MNEYFWHNNWRQSFCGLHIFSNVCSVFDFCSWNHGFSAAWWNSRSSTAISVWQLVYSAVRNLKQCSCDSELVWHAYVWPRDCWCLLKLASTALDPCLYLSLGCGFVFTIRHRSRSYDLSASVFYNGPSSSRNTVTTYDFSFLVLCRWCAIGLSAEKSCLPPWPRLETGCWVPRLRMLSSRSATADNGSQLARCLCSLLLLGILSHRTTLGAANGWLVSRPTNSLAPHCCCCCCTCDR